MVMHYSFQYLHLISAFSLNDKARTRSDVKSLNCSGLFEHNDTGQVICVMKNNSGGIQASFHVNNRKNWLYLNGNFSGYENYRDRTKCPHFIHILKKTLQ